MKKLERWYYEKLYGFVLDNLLELDELLDLNNYDTLKRVFSYRDTHVLESDIDKFMFKLKQEDKDILLKIWWYILEDTIIKNLELMEWWLKIIEWYELPVDIEEYKKQDKRWHWWLIKVVDLKGDYVTDKTMVDNFNQFLKEVKEKEPFSYMQDTEVVEINTNFIK